MKLALSTIPFLWIATVAIADIPDIDSSDWSSDPNDHGMTAKEYIQAESRALMSVFLGRSAINEFFHFEELTRADDHWVVSPNNDTIYSLSTRLAARHQVMIYNNSIWKHLRKYGRHC